MTPNTPPKPPVERRGLSRSANTALAVLTGSVGCLTIVITGAAMFLGLWVDGKFDSKPWFTLGIMLLSLPLSLYVMFTVVRWTTSRMTFENANKKSNTKKGKNID